MHEVVKAAPRGRSVKGCGEMDQGMPGKETCSGCA